MASVYKVKDSENWYYSISYNGKHYQGSTKTKDKKSAQLIAESIQTDIAREKHDLPSILPTQQEQDKLFKDIWLEYSNSLQNTPAAIIVKNNIYDKHLSNYFDRMTIAKIAIVDVKDYQRMRRLEILNMPKNSGKRESEISFAFLNKEILILHNFFNFCIEKGYLDKNPVFKVKKLNELSRLKTFSDDDILKLINGATNKLTKDLITFLIFSGCRKGEALNLKWDDVDLKNNVIAIKGTKTKYDRYIPISKPLKELLSGITKNQDCLYVFQRNGQKLTDFKRSFHTACRNAGFKDLHIHDLRHVFASKMVMNGTSLFITGELLGHRTTQMTKRYSHLVPETLKKAVDDVFK
jgi:integrase